MSEIKRINTKVDLKQLAQDLGVRHDWHEPDEQEVTARVKGAHLDNAFGSTAKDYISHDYAEGPVDYGEYNVIISQDGQEVAVVNLASLLAFACDTWEGF